MAKLHENFSFTFLSPQPFNFHLTASAYNFNWFYNGQSLYLPLSRKPDVVAKIEPVDKELVVKVFSKVSMSKDEVEDKVVFALGLQEELSSFYEIAFNDPLLRYVPLKLKGMHLRCCSPWLALLIALCQQNASFRQGWSMVYHVLELLGLRVEVDGRIVPLPPTPMEVVEAGLKQLKAARLGYRVETLFMAANWLMDYLRGEEPDEASILALKEQVKGIGTYTLRVALLFGARRYEEPPVDRWLVKVVSEAYGQSLKGLSEAEAFIKQRWHEWGGLFAFFTTIVTDAEPGLKAIKRVREGFLEPKFDFSQLTPMTMWRLL